MKNLLMLLIAVGILHTGPIANAQICASGYDRTDRKLVIRQRQEVSIILTRLSELAVLSASEDNLYRTMAYDAEFQALLPSITQFGSRVRRRASLLTNNFLKTVIDADYLGLIGLTVTGSTINEAKENSRNALDSLNMASNELDLCLYGSWIRTSIEGIPNDGNCAGGFDRSGKNAVMRAYNKVMPVLFQMIDRSRKGAVGVYSSSQRKVLDFDLQYFKEEVDIVGNLYSRAPTARTRNFIKTIVDPVFLGFYESTLTGDTLAQGQEHSRLALEKVLLGVRTLRQCIK